jgi:hypothetical protein
MKRQHELGLRQPELTSLDRASGFNKVVVDTIIASMVGLAFPRAAKMETAMSGLWPTDCCVFKDADSAPSMVTNRPETIQLEKSPFGTGIRFSLFGKYI